MGRARIFAACHAFLLQLAPDSDTAPARISQPQHIVAQNSNFLTIVKPELLLLMMQVVGKICRATAKLKLSLSSD